jgi:carbamoyl-phosphate synthase large subunit
MKILIAGAGGAPSEGVIKSLQECDKGDEIIGMGSEPADLVLSAAQKKYFVPYANHPDYEKTLFDIIEKEKPDLLHCQNDLEIFEISKLRDKITAAGVKLYLPSHQTIDTCVHKYKSYLQWKASGVVVPENILINTPEDLKLSFEKLGDASGKIWLRSTELGGGGKGALPTNDYEFGKRWIENYNGWGKFIAAEMLTPETVTWLSLWHEGELVVAQTRARRGWTHANRTLSGVTGVTKVGVTVSDENVTAIALNSVKSIDEKPHGIFGVDMAYDKNGIPNPTEINIARFFTTVLFFTQAGLNMPKIYKDIALYNEFPQLQNKINPLENGLMWMRGMDTEPRLLREADVEKQIIYL